MMIHTSLRQLWKRNKGSGMLESSRELGVMQARGHPHHLTTSETSILEAPGFRSPRLFARVAGSKSHPAKSELENCYSFNVVFSSDTSMYRFTGKRVSHDRFAQCIAVLSHGVRPRWFSFEGRLFAGSFKGPARIVDSLIVPRKTPWEQP